MKSVGPGPVKYTSCRPSEGGKPACRLGTQCRSVEIRGLGLDSVALNRAHGLPVSPPLHNTSYDYFVIMESPDFIDDKVGSIGHGKSIGKLIEFVDRAGVPQDKVFLTYLVRCLPPKRKPTVQEIKACIPHIKKEIETYNPKVILTLGNTPLRLFNLHNIGGINAARGRSYRKTLSNGDDKVTSTKKWTVIPTLDPGVFFHRPDKKLEVRVVEDYRAAKNLVDSGLQHWRREEYAVNNYELIGSFEALEKLIEHIKEHKFFAFDTESRSLPWYREPLICLSFCTPDYRTFIVPIYKHDPWGLDWKLKSFWTPSMFNKKVGFPGDEPDDWENLGNVLGMAGGVKVLHKLKEVFEDPTIRKAAHNMKYDMNVLRRHGDIRVQGELFDTLLMHHILFEHKPHDLEYLADLEFEVGDYSKLIKQIVGRGKKLKQTYDNIPDDILWKYAATDAEMCMRLAARYHAQLLAKPHLWNLYKAEAEQSIHTLAEAEWRGSLLDENVIDELLKEYKKDQDRLLMEMRKVTNPEFNPLSHDQVAKEIRKAGYGDKIEDAKKAKGYDTSKDVLADLRRDLDVADKVLKYRTNDKMIKTYLVNAKNDIDDDYRIRISFLIHGTETGRLSCRFLHQIPRVDKQRIAAGLHNMRDMFIAPPGSKIVYLDYSQIELRILAYLAQDEYMLKLFAEDADIHTITAAAILGIEPEDVVEFNRQNCGKNVNFGLSYGSQGYQLVKKGEWEDDDGIRRPITWHMLRRGMARFNEQFPGVAAYPEVVVNEALMNGGTYVSSFGRERRMGARLNDQDEYVRKAAERELVNFTIQSPAGAVTTRTLNLVHSKLRDTNVNEDDAFLVNTVHDSGAWEVKDYLVDWFTKSLKILAERPIAQLGGLSFPVDIGVGQSWSEAEANAKI